METSLPFIRPETQNLITKMTKNVKYLVHDEGKLVLMSENFEPLAELEDALGPNPKPIHLPKQALVA